MSARSPGSQLFKKQQEKHNGGAKQRYIHISNLELYVQSLNRKSHQLCTLTQVSQYENSSWIGGTEQGDRRGGLC